MTTEEVHVRLGVAPSDLFQLSLPTPPERIKTRPDRAWPSHRDDCQGKYCRVQRDPNFHAQLSYVDARYVEDRLDDILGPFNWQRGHQIGPDGVISAGIGIRVLFDEGPEWVWKWDGAGMSDIEGEKGAFSDSFKRAGVAWGIARDLYGDSHSSAASGVASSPATVAPAPAAATPPAAGATTPAAAPEGGTCPRHGTPWTTTKRDGTPAKRAYCKGKLDDGSWCDQKGPWLTPKDTSRPGDDLPF